VSRQAFLIAGELVLFAVRLALFAWLVVLVLSDLEARR
jgi:hypothetical protein